MPQHNYGNYTHSTEKYLRAVFTCVGITSYDLIIAGGSFSNMPKVLTHHQGSKNFLNT